MTKYNGIPVTLEPHISVEGDDLASAIGQNIRRVHDTLKTARSFKGAAGHTLKRVYLVEAQPGLRPTRGGKLFRRLRFEYDSLPDVFGRFETDLSYEYDFEVPEGEQFGPEVDYPIKGR